MNNKFDKWNYSLTDLEENELLTVAEINDLITNYSPMHRGTIIVKCLANRLKNIKINTIYKGKQHCRRILLLKNNKTLYKLTTKYHLSILIQECILQSIEKADDLIINDKDRTRVTSLYDINKYRDAVKLIFNSRDYELTSHIEEDEYFKQELEVIEPEIFNELRRFNDESFVYHQ